MAADGDIFSRYTHGLTNLDFRFLTVHRPQDRDQIVEQRGERLLERERFAARALWRHAEVVQHRREFGPVDAGVICSVLLAVGSANADTRVILLSILLLLLLLLLSILLILLYSLQCHDIWDV